MKNGIKKTNDAIYLIMNKKKELLLTSTKN